MKLVPNRYSRTSAPSSMLTAVDAYEQRFAIQFESLLYFPVELLTILHQRDDTGLLPTQITVASQADSSVLTDIERLTQVANTPVPAHRDRQEYYEALRNVYSKLPAQPVHVISRGDSLCVGIQREGGILAEAMGWLSGTENIRPDVKRIPYEHGLLVGVSRLPALQPHTACVIIDGAIASGATIISIMEELRPFCSSFFVFSVHGAYEGLYAILRYSSSANISVALNIGHATGGINGKFYAVVPGDPGRVVVGDLGDTITAL